MATSQNSVPTMEEHTAQREAWDAIAEGYDRYVAPQEVDLAVEALALAGLKSGDRFLDVAAGTGGLSLPAARLGAHVVATELDEIPADSTCLAFQRTRLEWRGTKRPTAGA